MAPSNRFALLFLFTSGLLVNVTYAIQPANYTPTWFDNMFCNQENKEVLNGCVGPPGTCRRVFTYGPRNYWDCRKYVECELVAHPADYTGPNTAKANVIHCPGTPDDAEFSWMTRKCGPWGAPGTCSWRSKFSWDQWHKMCPSPNGCEHGITTRDEVWDEPVKVPGEYLHRITNQYCKNNPEVAAGCKINRGCKYRHPDNCTEYIECVMDDHVSTNTTTANAIIRQCSRQRDNSGRVLQWSDVTKKCEPAGTPGTCDGVQGAPTLPAGKVVFTEWCGSMLSDLRMPAAFQRPPFSVFGDCFSYFECLPYALGVGQVKHCPPGQIFMYRYAGCKTTNGTLWPKLPMRNGSCWQREFGIGLKLSGNPDSLVVIKPDIEAAKAKFEVEVIEYVKSLRVNNEPISETQAAKLLNSSLLNSRSSPLHMNLVPEEATNGEDSPVLRYSLSGDCFSFIESSRKGFGQNAVKRCPSGQMFNLNTRECRLANANGTCLQYVDTSSQRQWHHVEDRAAKAGFLAPISTKEERVILSQLKPGSYCTALDFERTGCKDPNDCVYPYLWDCFSYIKCTPDGGSKNLTAHWMWCPQGQQYSVSERMCKPAGSPGTCAEANYTTHLNNEKYCSINAVREAGCQDSTDCTYAIPGYIFAHGWSKCAGYVQCNQKLREYGKTGTANITYCAGSDGYSDNEYSNKTQKCESRGRLGTCSAKEDERTLSRRNEGSEEEELIEPYLNGLNTSYSDREISIDCCRRRTKDGRCMGLNIETRLTNHQNCSSYILCTLDSTGKRAIPLFKQCGSGTGSRQTREEWNGPQQKCDFAGAPGTCSGKTNPADYGFTCPRMPFTLEDARSKTPRTEFMKPAPPYPYLFPNPAGICNAVANCYPQDPYEPQWPMMFCRPGQYWSRDKGDCVDLGRAGDQSMCEVPKDFTCPRKASARDDCEAYTFTDSGKGLRCTSPKGPEWYIACVQYAGSDKKTKPYELRCPFNSVFDLNSARCKFPNAPKGWTKEEFGPSFGLGFPFDYGDFTDGSRPSVS